MYTVLAVTTIEVDTFLWIMGIVLGIIGALILAICWFYYNLIQKMEGRIDGLDTKLSTEIGKVTVKDDLLTSKIEQEAKERVDKHEAFATRVFTEIDRVKEKTSDISETMAGFGTIYLTRNEYNSMYRREENR